MSKITIQNVSGANNVFGDNNTVVNNFAATQSENKVLIRDDYFKIILEIRELERISIDEYLEDKFQKLIIKNPNFIKVLYKDIYKVLEGVDQKGDNDLLIENGDFVIEYGDFKMTGHPTNLHYALTWLHIKLLEIFAKEEPTQVLVKMTQFENDFLKINNDTPAITKKISDIRLQLKKAGKSKEKSKWTWKDFNEMIQLKPNLMGLGINLNAVLERLFKH